MAAVLFNKLCIIGVGLIGGSIAKAAREQQLAASIVGFGREMDRPNLETALQTGVIDTFFLDVAAAVDHADAVVIATPVTAVATLFGLLKPHWDSRAVYSDVGSTKGSVLAAAESVFGHVPDNFIPAHPIAGGEQSGVMAAQGDLFKGKRLIITPTATSNPGALAKIGLFWQGMGACVTEMDVREHDHVLAATSHLPHILAFALVELLGHKDETAEIFQYAAGGFKDFTRIASSDPAMWQAICLANKQEIVPLIGQLKDELDKIQRLLVADDGDALFATFAYAREARQRFLEQWPGQ